MENSENLNFSKVQENMTLNDYIKDGFKVMVEATRSSNSLPGRDDWAYYSINDNFKKCMENESERILQIMNRLLRKQEIEENIRNRDVQEKTELIIEANDTVLEKVANNIDELNGIRRKPSQLVELQTITAQLPINGSWNRLNKASFAMNSSSFSQQQAQLKSVTLLAARNIVKPQNFFKDKIDNSNDNPWMPRIKEKPNSLKPLAIFLEESEFGDTYSHPYEFELERFTPIPEQLIQTEAVFPKLIEETPLYEVNTPGELNNMLEDLYKHTEIAIDLEHHSYRSFMGITCLMQISTCNADYIIDTLALRDKLYILNEVFTNPSIVKIFHGAISDIEWLQRDLSLYIVNMFDTHFASKELGYTGLSLSYLLTKFCNIKPNKHFQLADWRIRPLPDELKTYARMDTHYLIYIYRMLKNELLQKANGKDNLLKSVIHKGTQLCSKRYIKPLLKEDSHLEFYRKSKRIFDNRQMYALKELYRWRDKIAREEDESTGYVLPNHMLLKISEKLPREMQGILACCNPIPVLVRSNLLQLHQFILKAREQPTIKPILKEGNRSRGSTQKIFKTNIESPLHCPHDLSKQQEFRDDLPILLSSCSDKIQATNIEEVTAELLIEKKQPSISIFATDGFDDAIKSRLKMKNLKFLGPFDRYQLVKPYIAAEEAKETAKKAEASAECNDRTDEERIAALHEHFKSVSQLVPQKLSSEEQSASNAMFVNLNPPVKVINKIKQKKSLVKMGGRKRRREEVEEQDNYNGAEAKSSMITPVPFIKPFKDSNTNKKRFRKRKRKNNDSNLQFEDQQYPPQKRQKQNNQPQNQNINQQQMNTCDKGKSSQNKAKKTRAQFFKDKQKKVQRSMNDSQSIQGNLRNERKNFNNPSFGKGRKEDNFRPFDYASVDYSQFKTNDMIPNRNQFKTKFKGKVSISTY
ncbi:exosome component 10 [Agrilus planipennis]|uniref:Exosome complex component 10 homolog n=1 Tax=Agrilus planipennis TaxID=224129 RepID=A0A1W4XHP4_AGRPL|nr:exosome component 10 [Agrilus planipennis]